MCCSATDYWTIPEANLHATNPISGRHTVLDTHRKHQKLQESLCLIAASKPVLVADISGPCLQVATGVSGLHYRITFTDSNQVSRFVAVATRIYQPDL